MHNDRSAGEEWLRGTSISLKRTRLGLHLVHYGFILVFLATLGVLYFQFTIDMQSLVMKLLPLMGLAGNLMIFAGAILCQSIPEEAQTRRLLVGAIVGMIANLIFTGTFDFAPEILSMPVALLLKLIGYSGWILFALVLNKLLIYINRADQTVKVAWLLVTTVLFLLGEWLMELLAYLKILNIRTMTIYVTILLGLAAYAWIVGSLKKALVPQD